MVLLLVLVVAWAAVTAPFVLTAPESELREADAIVALAGGEGRLDVAQGLVAAGRAPVLVVSEVDEPGETERRDVCASPPPDRVCFVPDPLTTHGEARAVGRLVERHGWQSLVVVTNTHHAARAGRLVRQCFDGEVDLVHVGFRRGPVVVYDVLREMVALPAAVTVRRAC